MIPLKKLSLLVIAALLFAALMMPATGAITATSLNNYGLGRSTINLFTIPWTSAADGTAGGIIADSNGAAIQINGVLLQAGFTPGSGVTDLYDVTISNSASVDVLGGLGANLSSSSAKQDTPVTTSGFPFVLAGSCTLSVSNAGNAKTGTIYLYVKQN